MSKADRWIFTIALNLCAIPIIALGIFYQLLPDALPSLIPKVTVQIHKADYLITCLFMLIPLIIIVFAAFLRYRKVITKNYTVMAVVSMLLSVAYTAVTVYCIVDKTSGVQLARKIDFSTLVCCVLCLAISAVGTLLYGLKPNEAVGFVNRYTSSDGQIWTGVHNILSYIANGMFTVLAAVLAFFRGWHVVAIVVAALLLFVFAVTYFVSFLYKRYFERKVVEMA